MARRKNTAEAFEVFRRVYEETQAKKPKITAAGQEPPSHSADVPSGGAGAGSLAVSEGASRPAVPAHVPKSPLLRARPGAEVMPRRHAPAGRFFSSSGLRARAPQASESIPAAERGEAQVNSGFRKVMDRWFLGSCAAEGFAGEPFQRGAGFDPQLGEELSRLALERRELLRALARELSEGHSSAQCFSPESPAAEAQDQGSSVRGGGVPVLSCVQSGRPEGDPARDSPKRGSQSGEAGSFSEGGGGDLREDRCAGDRTPAEERRPVVPRRTFSQWVLGPTISAFLDRTIELRISTLVSLVFALTTVLFVLLLYSGMPARREPLFPEIPYPVGVPAEPEPVGAADPREPAGAGERLVATDAGTEPTPVKEPAATGKVPPVRWSPDLEVSPEVPTPSRSAERSGGSGQAQSPEAVPRRTYAIQVRARESWEGAGRLLDYFRQLGYSDVETEPEGKDAAGEALFTVFVGRYGDHEEARRACERLKEETRRRPYRYGRDCFQQSFVVTRTRS